MINKEQLERLLDRIDSNLSEPQTICLIGSSATILHGQTLRQTEDIDVWSPASKIQRNLLMKAVESAGLKFDPTEDDPGREYLQIVHPDIVRVPEFNSETGLWLNDKESSIVWQGKNLRVTTPPLEAIIVSKTLRFTQQDISDCLWILANNRVDAEHIKKAINALPDYDQEMADENYSVLGFLKNSDN